MDPELDEAESSSSISSIESPSEDEQGGLTDEQIQSNIRTLSQIVTANPADYQSRLQLIGLLRQQEEEDDLAYHREALAKHFPLGAQIWLEWLQDEEARGSLDNGALSLEDYERIQGLYRSATTDYLSIDLYLHWASFMEKALVESLEAAQNGGSNQAPTVSFDNVRQYYEYAVEMTQHHLGRAGEIWERYRAFEDLVASTIDENADKIEVVASVQRKRALYHRELAHPHLNLAKVFADSYVPWEAEIGDQTAPLSEGEKQDVRSGFDRSWAEMEARLAYEVELQDIEEHYAEKLEPDYTRLDAVRKYIQFESSQTPLIGGRVQCLYERTLAMYYYVLDLWQAYAQFMLKAPREIAPLQALEETIAVLRRGIRNYPYSHHLWCKLFMTLEQRLHVPEYKEEPNSTRREITEIFERALQAGLQSGSELMLVYKQMLDFRVRTVSNWKDTSQVTALLALLESARTYFDSYLPDQTFELEKYWANMVWAKLGDEDQTRHVYEQSVRRDPKATTAWLAFIQFEISVHQPANARSLYKRAFSSELDAPDYLWATWLDFERAYGSLESFAFASDKIEKKHRDHALKQATRDATRQAALEEADKEIGGRKGGNRKGEMRIQKKKAFVQKEMREPLPSKLVKADAGAVEAPANNSALYKKKQPLPNFDPVTLHVAGIPSAENLTAAPFIALFSPYGQVVDVRFAKNQSGQLKGFVFVQFKEASSSKEVRKNIKEGKTFVLNFEGQEYPLRVTAAVGVRPPKASPVPGLEEFKHTVFVSNLSPFTTTAHLEEFIKKIGAPTPVSARMPTDRKTGESRCIAYLDFDDESLVQKSVDLLKDKMLDGRRLKAAPSAPTKARAHGQDQATSSSLGSLGGNPPATASAAASVSKPLVPRSVAVKHNAPKQRLAIAKPAPASGSQMDTS